VRHKNKGLPIGSPFHFTGIWDKFGTLPEIIPSSFVKLDDIIDHVHP